MAWYWYLAIYVVGYFVAWRVGYSWAIGRKLHELEHKNSKRRPAHYDGRRCSSIYCCALYELNESDRFDATVGSAIASAFWPVTSIGFAAYLFATRPTRAELKLERRQAEQVELNKLRKQAKELGLPFPEITDNQ